MMRTMRPLVVLLALALTALPRAGFAAEWEIEPADDPRVPLGKISVVGGALGTEPMVFVLKNLTTAMPLEITLVAADAQQPIEISVYKETPDKALLTGTATNEKPIVFRFRTGDQVYFSVHGADGAHYELLTWVWPEIEIEDDSSIIPVSEYPASPPRVTKEPRGPDQSPAPGTSQAPGTLVLGLWPSIILGLILLALVAIIVLLWRRGSKTGAAVLLSALLVQAVFADEQKGIPKKKSPEEEKPPTKKQLKDFAEEAEKVKKLIEALKEKPAIVTKPTKTEPGVTIAVDKYTDKNIAFRVTKDVTESPKHDVNLLEAGTKALAGAKFILGLMEQFGFIDPREAAIQKNLNPPGMPLLPSRCAKDWDCRACYKKANADLTNAHSLLEEQYVIYKQTELKAGRIIELADAAADGDDRTVAWPRAAR
jgi:hypothetical protein